MSFGTVLPVVIHDLRARMKHSANDRRTQITGGSCLGVGHLEILQQFSDKGLRGTPSDPVLMRRVRIMMLNIVKRCNASRFQALRPLFPWCPVDTIGSTGDDDGGLDEVIPRSHKLLARLSVSGGAAFITSAEMSRGSTWGTTLIQTTAGYHWVWSLPYVPEC